MSNDDWDAVVEQVASDQKNTGAWQVALHSVDGADFSWEPASLKLAVEQKEQAVLRDLVDTLIHDVARARAGSNIWHSKFVEQELRAKAAEKKVAELSNRQTPQQIIDTLCECNDVTLRDLARVAAAMGVQLTPRAKAMKKGRKKPAK
jgi:hypothetical protein